MQEVVWCLVFDLAFIHVLALGLCSLYSRFDSPKSAFLVPGFRIVVCMCGVEVEIGKLAWQPDAFSNSTCIRTSTDKTGDKNIWKRKE